MSNSSSGMRKWIEDRDQPDSDAIRISYSHRRQAVAGNRLGYGCYMWTARPSALQHLRPLEISPEGTHARSATIVRTQASVRCRGLCLLISSHKSCVQGEEHLRRTNSAHPFDPPWSCHRALARTKHLVRFPGPPSVTPIRTIIR
jgi:hypothetical protein